MEGTPVVAGVLRVPLGASHEGVRASWLRAVTDEEVLREILHLLVSMGLKVEGIAFPEDRTVIQISFPKL